MRGITTGIVTLAACAALSACGGASAGTASTSGAGPGTSSRASSTSTTAMPGAKELGAQAIATLDKARSMRVTGTIPDEGKLMHLDAAGLRRGRDVTVTVSSGAETTQIVRKGSEAYVRVGPAGKPLTVDWQHLTASEAESLGDDLSVQAMIDEIIKEPPRATSRAT